MFKWRITSVGQAAFTDNNMYPYKYKGKGKAVPVPNQTPRHKAEWVVVNV
jgi:hypothetical protein